jgi:hypothetical protein
MRRTRFVTAVIVSVSLAAPLSAQQPPSSTIKAQLIARIQVQYSTTSVDEAELIAAGRTVGAIPSTMFEVRRARFGASLSFSDWLTGELETEVAMARLQMRNMYANMAFAPELELRVGQFKKPFSLMELNSETVWPIIERGVRIRGLNDALLSADSMAGSPRAVTSFRGNPIPGDEYEILNQFGYLSYDLGAMLHGKLGGLGYSLGLFNGEGSDRADGNDDKSYAARLTYKLNSKMPVVFGAAASRRETRTAQKPAFVNATGTAFELDVELGAFRRAGLHFVGEVTTGDNLAADDDFTAAQGVLAYFKPVASQRVEGIEFAARASYGDPRKDIDDDEGLLLTPGFNVYFNGRNRLMINWDFYSALGGRLSNENALRVQAQIYQ